MWESKLLILNVWSLIYTHDIILTITLDVDSLIVVVCLIIYNYLLNLAKGNIGDIKISVKHMCIPTNRKVLRKWSVTLFQQTETNSHSNFETTTKRGRENQKQIRQFDEEKLIHTAKNFWYFNLSYDC